MGLNSNIAPRSRALRDGFYRPPAWVSTDTGDPALMGAWRWLADTTGKSAFCFVCYEPKLPGERFCGVHLSLYGFEDFRRRGLPIKDCCQLCRMPFGEVYKVGRWVGRDEDRNDLCLGCALRERFATMDLVVEAAALHNEQSMRVTARIESTLERRGVRDHQDVIRRVADSAWGNAWMVSLLKHRYVTVRQAAIVIVRLAQRIVAEVESGRCKNRDRVIYYAPGRRVAA